MFRLTYLGLGLILGFGTHLAAQTQVDLRTQSKGVDFQAATYTRPLRASATLPSTCTVNELLLLTTAPAGSNIYACMSVNNWVIEAGGAGVALQNGGAAIGTSSTENFVPGIGVFNAITNLGTKVNIQQGVDTSVILATATNQAGQAVLCQPSSGSGSIYTCSLTPTLNTYTTGMVLNWIPDVTTGGSGATLNVDLLGAVPVMESDGATNPAPAEILAGRLYLLWYDGSVFRLSVAAATGGSGGSVATGPPNEVLATNSSGSSINSASLRSLTTADIPPVIRQRGFQVIFGGSDVAAGSVVYVTMPYACTASGYVVSADPAGTATVKIWKVADGTSLPTSANSISTAGFALASGGRVHSTNLTDLSTTAWAAYDTTGVLLSAESGSPNHVNFTLECDQ
jgi:hypothetical protein